ncbi:MAG: hypothetical protein REI78_15370 [Pedobacter sp.]|nr:hypothetical protein [Pedobacter sp.]MDQ8054411.1 hypothetical protein [Pedobacter sp.]
MRAINGGGLFGNNDSSNSGGLLGSIGIGNLLSYENSSQDGDESTHSSGSIGNGINLDLGGIFHNMTE